MCDGCTVILLSFRAVPLMSLWCRETDVASASARELFFSEFVETVSFGRPGLALSLVSSNINVYELDRSPLDILCLETGNWVR